MFMRYNVPDLRNIMRFPLARYAKTADPSLVRQAEAFGGFRLGCAAQGTRMISALLNSHYNFQSTSSINFLLEAENRHKPSTQQIENLHEVVSQLQISQGNLSAKAEAMEHHVSETAAPSSNIPAKKPKRRLFARIRHFLAKRLSLSKRVK